MYFGLYIQKRIAKNAKQKNEKREEKASVYQWRAKENERKKRET